MLKYKIYQVGVLAANCCIITDCESGCCAIVDPGDKSPELTEAVNAVPNGNIKYILLTHGHFDHIGFAGELKKKTGASLVIGKGDEDFLSDPRLNLCGDFGKTSEKLSADLVVCDGDSLKLGNTEIKVISLPGHTKGGTGYLADGKLFCGDTLFKESMGRTDFPTGNENELLMSLNRLSRLPDETRVICGHGERTTIGEEKLRNPCMRYAINKFGN